MVSAATKVLLLLTTSGRFSNSSQDVPFGTGWWWAYAGISAFLVIFAGIMSGLTLGLMSLGLVDLEVLQRSGSDTEKKQAAKILPVVQKQHQLLVTLLLCNAVAMEALPIFLDRIFNPVAAVILSVTFVLAFGEVFPQAICSRYGLAVGANLVWLVRILMCICYLVAFPIGKILDALLGHDESALFRRAQLKAFVLIHSEAAGKGGELTHDETTIINGALDLTTKTVEEAMTPIESTFSLDVTSRLSWEVMEEILARGHSRVPVYAGNPRNITGLLLVKNLLKVRTETETHVGDVSIRRIPRVPADMPLYDILNEFQHGNSHMAAVIKTKVKQQHDEQGLIDPIRQNRNAGKTGQAVGFPNENLVQQYDLEKCILEKCIHYDDFASLTDLTGLKNMNVHVEIQKDERPPNDQLKFGLVIEDIDNDGEVIGIITLEDVIEELLQEEIVDETDVYIDVHKRIRVVSGPASKISSIVHHVGSYHLMANSGRQGTKRCSSSKNVRSNDNTTNPRYCLSEPLLGNVT